MSRELIALAAAAALLVSASAANAKASNRITVGSSFSVSGQDFATIAQRRNSFGVLSEADALCDDLREQLPRPAAGTPPLDITRPAVSHFSGASLPRSRCSMREIRGLLGRL
jgi:hypothetical protein